VEYPSRHSTQRCSFDYHSGGNSVRMAEIRSHRAHLPGMRYQPMTSVAGDFYDFLASSDDVLTILVADVRGTAFQRHSSLAC
jgi:hypothetical protein